MSKPGSVFRPFPAPVAPREAMDALYEAFADIPRPEGPFCDRCFDIETERRVLKPVALREADPRDFAAIYFEHMACSVGGQGFFHFLPRGLETKFFDVDIHPDFAGLAVSWGLYSLEEARQQAIADAAAATARTFFAGRRPEPFQDFDGSGSITTSYFRAEAGVRLIRLLLAVRVDPWEIFCELVEIGGEIVWETLAAALNEDAWISESVKSSRGTDISATIGTIAWLDFFRVVDTAALAHGCRWLDRKGPRSRRPEAVVANYNARLASLRGASRRKLAGMLHDAVAERQRETS